jgi:hypothetical protein
MPEGGFQKAKKTRDEVLRENAFKPGCAPGPGRPKGSRAKLGEAFLEAMHADFAEHGAETIVAVREGKPDQYLKVVASILPKEIEAGERLSETLTDILERIDGRTRTISPREHRETVQ